MLDVGTPRTSLHCLCAEVSGSDVEATGHFAPFSRLLCSPAHCSALQHDKTFHMSDARREKKIKEPWPLVTTRHPSSFSKRSMEEAGTAGDGSPPDYSKATATTRAFSLLQSRYPGPLRC